jgi:hypothetical protein
MLPSPKEDEIRILSLLPAPFDVNQPAPIECEIDVAPLSNLPDYEALSYVWGVDKASVPITVAGQDIMISRTLNTALVRLRLPDRKRLLWVDQLCIDQSNDGEKTQQVQHMSNVYSECSQCVVWLGEVNPSIPLADAEAACRFLRYMAEAWRADDPNDVPMPVEVSADFNATVTALATIERRQNKWWDRIWTVQEGSLPENVVLQWGPFELLYSTFVEAQATWVTHYLDQFEPLLAGLTGINREIIPDLLTHVFWLLEATDYAAAPFELIRLYRFRQATDSRDGVYGVMGLCEKGRLPLTERCDYSVPAARVFNTLSKELIIHDKGLQALTCSPRQHPAEATPGIASWAFDLAGSLPRCSPDLWYHAHGYDAYNACNGLDDLDVAAIREQIGAETLSLTGIYIDTITRLHDGLEKNAPVGVSLGSETEQMLSLLPTWYKAATGCDFDTSDEHNETAAGDSYADTTYDRKEAFARFLVSDVIRIDRVDGRQARFVNADDIQNLWKIMTGRQDEVDMNTQLAVCHSMVYHNMLVTETGLIGNVCLDARVGDQVWVFRGGKVPFMIRPREGDGNGYTFVAQCYVQGVMQGEMTKRQGLVEQTVCLY